MRKKPQRKYILLLGNPQSALIIYITTALFLFSISRLLLYWFNTGLFPGQSLHSIAGYYLKGLRFDLSALLYGNLPVILLLLLPFRTRTKPWYQKLTRVIFIITNSILLIPNLADAIYFRFTMKRLTGDIFTYLTVGSDVNLFLQFLKDFWYIFLIWIIFIVLLILIGKWIRISTANRIQQRFWYYVGQIILTILFSGLTILGMRGGLQLKPIGIMNAAEYAEAQDVPLVLNSAFTIMKTLDQRGLERKSYFPLDQELNSAFNPESNYANADSTGNILPMNRKNIVLIILESFSREHFSIYGQDRKQGFTPFLDSLSKASATFNGFANGKRSIEGIPAILGGLPTWMEQDFITSMYASNKTNSLSTLLKKEGYVSHFFHGGTNGTMGFDHYAKSTGFDHYHGRTEYNNDNDYDGKWGIWDEPFLLFVARELDKSRQPFLASVFTLSSHHPYKVPEKYKDKFRKGNLQIQETIMYADYALQQFFQTASGMPWYNNTLFVITADHTSEAFLPEYKTRLGQYRIPIFFFTPTHEFTGESDMVMQQTDILPTIMDYLNYPGPFVAFGSSVLDRSKERFALSLVSGSYQLVMGDYVMQWDGTDKIQLFNYVKDPLMTTSVSENEKDIATRMEYLLKAVIQQYNNRMIDNRLVASP